MDALALFDAFHHARGLRLDPEITSLTAHHLGELVVTSGQLMVGDPLLMGSSREPFTDVCLRFSSHPVAPGRYPVVVEVAHFAQDEQRVALAMIIFGEQRPVTWVNACPPREEWDAEMEQRFGPRASRLPSWPPFFQHAAQAQAQSVDDAFLGYEVDTALGCFLDAATAGAFAEVLQPAALDEYLDEFDLGIDDPLSTALDKHSVSAWMWANYCVNEETGANVIAFSSGWGDGAYPSFFGYGEDEQIVCLLTDFGVAEGLQPTWT